MKFASTALATLLATSLSATGATAFFVPRVALPGAQGRSLVTAAALLPASIRGGSTATSTARCASSATAEETEETCTNGETSTTSSYEELVEALNSITHLSRAAGVLSYDQMVFMPQTAEASNERGKQSAALAAVIHEKSTDPKLGELLEKAEQEVASGDNQDYDAIRVIELARKAYDKKVKIPTELASRQASLSSEAYNTWVNARQQDDFTLYQDILQQEIEVAKEVASVVQTQQDKEAGKSLYATMLDEFETGMDVDRIDDIFAQIQNALVPLIERVYGKDATPPDSSALVGNFEIAKQEALSKQIVQTLGYDDERGRIDVSVHPFSSSISGKHDVRITSRFREDEWYQGLAGSIHEAGHAMYEQNVNDNGLPNIDNALSMGMHESQSLFWERHIGLSKEFWNYATPIVKENLSELDNDKDASTLYGAVNAVANPPALIRVEADELTYPLHVILRYNIERDFIEGRLEVKDIPQRWNAGMKDMLKVDVPSDATGCLQDVHWSMLAFGYFPTYLIGAAAAAQLAHYCKKDIDDYDNKIKAGQFDEIRAWMTDKVHQHGSRYKSLDEHLEAQLGEKLNPVYFIDYLTNKYTELYKC